MYMCMYMYGWMDVYVWDDAGNVNRKTVDFNRQYLKIINFRLQWNDGVKTLLTNMWLKISPKIQLENQHKNSNSDSMRLLMYFRFWNTSKNILLKSKCH